eukprot:CAMPEP_0117431840 /NCGR_PEP_ID=MMETSP0758-20121206/11383_1 /TAXON_ID=63605 /ORGANISM="Percolomonas cosmopolitus, Strain AE-1 (ATCC 50343)" /LENGTH=39 /DNA_ID= /DNA_START= /DNA_END= /DNA_ORIENTATION=
MTLPIEKIEEKDKVTQPANHHVKVIEGTKDLVVEPVSSS